MRRIGVLTSGGGRSGNERVRVTSSGIFTVGTREGAGAVMGRRDEWEGGDGTLDRVIRAAAGVVRVLGALP